MRSLPPPKLTGCTITVPSQGEDPDTGDVAGFRFEPPAFAVAGGLLCSRPPGSRFGKRRSAVVRRFASLGLALALAVGTLVPIAHAQQSGKTLVLGFSQEPDTFVAGEGGLYVTQVA